MSFALLQSAALLPVELTMNRVLALDAASAARLATLEGRTLAVYTTRPAGQVFISVRSGKLHFAALFEGEPDASLRGSFSAMTSLLLKGNKISSLAPQQLELRGNTAFVQDLQTLLFDLDLDWEYQLSRFTGDMPAAFVGKGLRQARDFMRQTIDKLQQDTVEYLHEETRLLPSAMELEAFYASVNQLMLGTDRLQARIEALSQQQKPTLSTVSYYVS